MLERLLGGWRLSKVGRAETDLSTAGIEPRIVDEIRVPRPSGFWPEGLPLGHGAGVGTLTHCHICPSHHVQISMRENIWLEITRSREANGMSSV